MASLLAPRSRETRFSRPNRRACSQPKSFSEEKLARAIKRVCKNEKTVCVEQAALVKHSSFSDHPPRRQSFRECGFLTASSK